jgi:hypothetical protein
MVLWEPKHVAAMFFSLIICYFNKLVLDCKVTYFSNYWKLNEDAWSENDRQALSVRSNCYRDILSCSWGECEGQLAPRARHEGTRGEGGVAYSSSYS